jgi:hypothetical protein
VVSLVQTESFGPIHVRARAQEAEGHGYDLEELDEQNDDAFETPEPEPEQALLAESFDDEFDRDNQEHPDAMDDSSDSSPFKDE